VLHIWNLYARIFPVTGLLDNCGYYIQIDYLDY